MSGASPIVACRLKVGLRRVSPVIWRRLLVPGELTLHGLRRRARIAFGWENHHLHASGVHGRGSGTKWSGQRRHAGDESDGADGLREPTLADLSLRLRPRILYEHDSRDLREHEVRLEAREAACPRRPRPGCVGGARAGPPEDVGGPDGHVRLLARLEDLRMRRLLSALARAGEDGSGGVECEDEDDDAWALAGSHGFDGEGDPLLRHDPAAFDRRAANAEPRREAAPAAPVAGQADGP